LIVITIGWLFQWVRMFDNGRSPNRRVVHKVVLLGDSRGGKTSLISRQLHTFDTERVTPTIGCHCSEVQVFVDDKPITLQLWDTAGQELYRALIPAYMRGADGVFIVYDMADKESFFSLTHWFTMLFDTLAPSTIVFLVANKRDLCDRPVVPDATGAAYAAERNANFFSVSALTGENVGGLFTAMGREIALHVQSDTASRVRSLDAGGASKCPC
jgi:small GTP-binding protein